MLHGPAVSPQGKDVTFYKEGPSGNKDLDLSLQQDCFSQANYPGLHGAGEKAPCINGEINL